MSHGHILLEAMIGKPARTEPGKERKRMALRDSDMGIGSASVKGA
jgi:hypothetical protein